MDPHNNMQASSLKFSWNIIQFHDERLIRLFDNIISWFVMVVAFSTYLTTIDHSASYWDCPEYITCASRLEVGHPPGNPVWMLAMRVATIPFPSHMHAMVVNACSALLMAFAAFFLTRITYFLALTICRHYCDTGKKGIAHNISSIPMVTALSAGLTFAFTDSAWFSAVEAEVYAMSAFFTSLSIWLMLKWSRTNDPRKQKRILILVAYITGLSLGVHQLNLLCIPVFALIFTFRRHPFHATRHAWAAIFISFGIVAAILTGMMKGALAWAMEFELFFVNTLHLPFFSGTIAYPALLTLVFAAAACAIPRGGKIIPAIALSLSLWMSGMFAFGGNLSVAAILAAAVAAILVFALRMSRVSLLTVNWMAAFLLLGFSSFALILIRGYAAPPMNEATPTDIFALSSYISRDQYGSKPLFYGATPYSKPMLHEDWTPGDSSPRYSRYVLKETGITRSPLLHGARLYHRSGLMDNADSIANMKALDGDGDRYIIADRTYTRVTTPELNMFFPRITGSSPSDIESYGDWVGMNAGTMTPVAISEAIDSLGNPVGRMLPDGSRAQKQALRPTYLQNLTMFLSYQAYYMYLRYLLWNFVGRQNDFHSTGEIEHGNFITGIKAIDNAMLGDQSLMPSYAGTYNPGRNVYYGIPFILGVIGIIYLFRCGKRGKRAQAIVTLLFLMTGIAIVVYLNQTPGEARERDYSFLGSFMAFCIWTGFGIMAIGIGVLRLHINWIAETFVLITLASVAPAILLIENFDDHIRTNRSEPLDFSRNILNLQRPSIIFTHGDNDTFPLWYAQETEGYGKRHIVIDVSYLATPGYVINLLKQGDNALPLTATPADIAYNAYAFTRIAPDADTVAVPLREVLRETYARKEGAPVINHSRVLIPGMTMADTLTVNLRSLAAGGSLIPFRTLMLLDIIATNNASTSPRPLHFLFPVKNDFIAFLKPALRQGVYSHVYSPATDEQTYVEEFNDNLIKSVLSTDLNKEKPDYADPVIADRVRRQRGALIMASSESIKRGFLGNAILSVEAIERLYPYYRYPAGSFTVADSTYHEGIGYERMLLQLRDSLFAEDPFDKGPYGWKTFNSIAKLHNRQILEQAQDWERYYRSLTPAQRNTVSASTRRIISSIPEIKKVMETDTLPHKRKNFQLNEANILNRIYGLREIDTRSRRR